MFALALLTVISFSTPSFYAVPDTICGLVNYSAPMGDLAQARLYGQRRNSPRMRLLRSKSEMVPGWADTVEFADSGAVWTVWMTFLRRTGAESCPSNLVCVNCSAGVSQPPATAADWYCYDVMGRPVVTLRGLSEGQAELWLTKHAPRAGVYLLRARLQGQVVVRKLVVRR